MNSPSSIPTASPGSGPEPARDDRTWFAEEIQPHEMALRQYVRREVPSVTDVDDVLQESYIKLLRARSRGGIASAKAYLYATVRNTALNFLRKRRIISPVPVADLPEWRVLDGAQDVLSTVNSHLQDELVASAVAELPERCREIFLLRVSDGLSYTEISVRLAIGESTVRTQVARAIEKCVRRLRDRGITPDR